MHWVHHLCIGSIHKCENKVYKMITHLMRSVVVLNGKVSICEHASSVYTFASNSSMRALASILRAPM